MVNAIIESISIALHAEFGDRYKNYREEEKQDLEQPCFYIFCMNHTNKLFLGKRYFMGNQFCVQYFPEQEGKWKEECYAIAERLFLCLEYITVNGDWAMGTNMKYELVDGILHFFVNYDMFVYKMEESLPAMEEISFKNSVKG